MERPEPLASHGEDSPSPRPPLWPVVVFLLVPLGIALAKQPGSPVSGAFSNIFSLTSTPRHLHHDLEYIFFVPMSAVVVSVFRLTLGLRVLGFFRPILMAIAFRVIGIPLGVTFLGLVLATVTILWPAIRSLPYYARVPVLLSLAAGFLVVPVMVAGWIPAAWLVHLAYFPIIALCLVSDTFAKLLDRKGPLDAAWRALTTIVAAVVITLVSELPGAMQLPLRYPELLLAQVGVVLLIGRFCAWNLVGGWNPFAPVERLRNHPTAWLENNAGVDPPDDLRPEQTR